MRWEICDFTILRNGFRQNVIKFLGFARAPLWYDVKTLKCLFNTYHIIFYFSTFSLAEPTQNALATSVTTRTDRTGWKRSFFLSLSSSYSSAPRPLQTRRRRSGSGAAPLREGVAVPSQCLHSRPAMASSACQEMHGGHGGRQETEGIRLAVTRAKWSVYVVREARNYEINWKGGKRHCSRKTHFHNGIIAKPKSLMHFSETHFWWW